MLNDGKLSVGGVLISLDDSRSETCFVSHAHSDHTSAFLKNRKIIASEETFTLMGRAPEKHPIPEVSLASAGHMFGARQLLAETESGRFAYTGDFSLHDSYTAKGAKILECDTLMIDSTYCMPHMRFPDRWQVMSTMEKFVRQNSGATLLFGAYASGKTQELISFFNRECAVAPLISGRAAEISARYEKCGLRLDYLAAGTPEADEAKSRPHVEITTPMHANFAYGAKLSASYGHKVKTAVATGWAAFARFPVDEAFPLSDHADFIDTMRYIHESGAKKVICANSGSKSAADYLRGIGVNAAAKEELGKGVQAILA
ncbi:MAG: hypothetical protein NT051_03495 [Candidatus Micrarchaeota archaeon]|nr:hypothetical protein [Candidatus Micrarchaeota archaeon]